MQTLITIITGVIETGALSFLIIILIKGLKIKISGLEQTIEVQNKTITAMDKRVCETEKISDLYKSFINDYPKVFEQYKATVVQSKDDMIIELEKRVEQYKGQNQELQDKINEFNPEEKLKFEKMTGYLFLKENKSFYEFIQKIEKPKDFLIYSLIKSNTFEEFMSTCGFNVVLDNSFSMKYFIEDVKYPKPIKTASFSVTGIAYAFTFDNEFVLNQQAQTDFNTYYKAIKE